MDFFSIVFAVFLVPFVAFWAALEAGAFIETAVFVVFGAASGANTFVGAAAFGAALAAGLATFFLTAFKVNFGAGSAAFSAAAALAARGIWVRARAAFLYLMTLLGDSGPLRLELDLAALGCARLGAIFTRSNRS
jgi:hypothetical protein